MCKNKNSSGKPNEAYRFLFYTAKTPKNKGDDFLSIIKKLTRVIVALILVCIIGVLILASPWILIFIGGWLSPNPPAPEITYGEFPFRLEYRIEDEVYVVEDVIV